MNILVNRAASSGHLRGPRRIDVRVLAATNRTLEREVNRGRFREDLYFRLSVFTVRLPPLRERPEDIPDLVRAFLERMGAAEDERLFTAQVYQSLARQDWPGNVRELRNYVERAIVLGNVAEASRANAPGTAANAGDPTKSPARMIDSHFKVAKEELISNFERAYLEQLMTWAAGNVSRASRKAKLDRMYLTRLLHRYEIKRDSEED